MIYQWGLMTTMIHYLDIIVCILAFNIYFRNQIHISLTKNLFLVVFCGTIYEILNRMVFIKNLSEFYIVMISLGIIMNYFFMFYMIYPVIKQIIKPVLILLFDNFIFTFAAYYVLHLLGIDPEKNDTFSIQIMFNSVLYLLIFTSMYIFKAKKAVTKINFGKEMYIVNLLVYVFIFASGIVMFKFGIDTATKYVNFQLHYEYVIFFGFCFIVLFVITKSIHRKIMNVYENKELTELLSKEYQQQRETLRTNREIKHVINNHKSVIYGLALTNSYKELEKYVCGLLENMERN